jgi:hypothetical protein
MQDLHMVFDICLMIYLANKITVQPDYSFKMVSKEIRALEKI